MKHISLLIPQGNCSLSNLEATYKMFTMANDFLIQQGKATLFEIDLVALEMGGQSSNSIFTISPTKTIQQIEKTDLIIIPAIHGNYREIIQANKRFAPWIIKCYKEGTEVASLCIGAFLLASTGLLNGKNCTTHWMASAEFKTMFPEINLMDDKIITDEHGIYTSGGAYSSLNLNLYLIEKFAGREMAILHSKIFEIEIDRTSQSPFIIFSGQKSHNDEIVLEAQEWMEQNYQEKINVDQLCDQFAIGRRTLERRFKKATGNTMIEYIQRVKIEVAKKQLETGYKNVNEVMYETGYSDAKSFRDVFKKSTGLSPIRYKEKFIHN